MSVTGIVVEYNPLHNGHLLHINETRKLTGCNSLVAVMSGNFVQRGEPSLINKWARAKMALEAGVDLVIELPLIYSISSAEGLAFGAVSTLDAIGVVDSICFGSELGNITGLGAIAKILLEEPVSYKSVLKDALKKGLSYPSARQYALLEYLKCNKSSEVSLGNIDEILSNSNNILGIEYIKALLKLSSKITPLTIRRAVNNYNDIILTGSISSATAIRSNLMAGNPIEGSIPEFSADIIREEVQCGRGPISLTDFTDMLLYRIRQSSPDALQGILDISEGLEYKIKESAENFTTLRDIVSSIKTRRYPSTKIQRILLYILLNLTKEVQREILSTPSYIRILGFNSRGRELLKEIKEKCNIPIITNPSRKDLELLRYDIDATDIYVLGYSNADYKIARQDLKQSPLIKG